MTARTKTISEINARLRNGDAVVMTALEFKNQVREGRSFTVDDVDVITTATRAIMSGTTATVVMPLAEAGRGAVLKRLFLNGVPCAVSMAADDDRDLHDVIISGTAESRDHHGRYGGGHLMRDLVEGKIVEVEAQTVDGRSVYSEITLDEMPFARIYAMRNVYQNYTAF